MEPTKCLGLFLFALLSSWPLVIAQQAGGCMQDLAQNEDFMRCSQSFASLMQEMQASSAASGPGDVQQIYAAFCTPEGKAGLKCLMDFIFECPEVEAAMQMGGTLNFKEMMKQGGIDVFCELTTSKNCRPKLQACSGKMNESSLIPGMEEGGMMMPGYEGAGTPPPDMGVPPPGMGAEMEMGTPPTPYNMVPMQMMTVCGQMHDMLTCIMGAMDECPKTAQYMEEMLMKMSEIQKQQGGPMMPSFADSKKYIIESCPSLPEDFKAKQMCIAGSMARQEFQECYNNVTDTKQNNCDVYFGGKQCVLKFVGADCGDNYANAIADASPLFSVDIPSDCEKPVGGVSNLQASVLTTIGATALLLLGRF